MTGDGFESWLLNPGREPLVMGVLNVTPDSFSDGGQFSDPGKAIAQGLEMVAQGASILDIGGESTRPGSQPVTEEEQLRRLIPVVKGLRDCGAVLSIDTTRSAVAAAALDAGAHLINDISAGRDDVGMLPLVAARKVPVALMHMQGTPATMQVDPRYGDVVSEVKAFLLDRARSAEEAGVASHRILLDPGFGFGKNFDHNVDLLRNVRALAALPYPVVIGTSRKSFLGKLTSKTDPADRVFATAATTVWAVTNGAAIVRVHDVGPNRDVIRVVRALG